jgi:hypothetical protein
MKLTTKMLKDLILETLQEKNKINFAIDTLERNNLKVHETVESDYISLKILDQDNRKIAELDAEKGGKNILNSFEVLEIHVREKEFKGNGLGALMMELLLEMAADLGVTPDRSHVSEDFEKILRFLNTSDDHEKKQLSIESPKGTFDAFNDIFYNEMNGSQEEYEEAFYKSHLTKVFYLKRKTMEAHEALNDRGLLIKEEEETNEDW